MNDNLLSLVTAVQEMIRHASDEPDPKAALRSLLIDCIAATGAESGRLFLLRLLTSAYQVAVQVGDDSKAGAPAGVAKIDLLTLETMVENDPSISPVARALVSRRPVLLGAESAVLAEARVVYPITRESACLGVIDLACTRPKAFDQDHLHFLDAASGIAALLYEKSDTLELFKALQQPIDYHLPSEQFFQALMRLVAEASQMPMIALREWSDGGELQCIAKYGFDAFDNDAFLLAPIDKYPTFYDVMVEGTTRIEPSMKADHLSSLRGKPQYERVRSFVACPVKVGTEVIGTLSFAAACELDFTTLEMNGFETISNAVGIAIKNFRHFKSRHDSLFEQAKVGAAVAVVEVAQAARHEARSHLEDAQASLAIIARLAKSPTRKDLELIRRHVEELDEIHQQMSLSLDRIKDVTKPPKRELAVESLRKLWEEAFNTVSGRLELMHISWRINGDARAEVYPDFLRHVFLNLILNSIDAFRDSKKSNRLITVTIDPQSALAIDVTIRYTDTGPGLDPSQLPPSEDGQRSVEDIFEPGVTTKEAGSGFGLFLARRIIGQHKGGIRLVDYRNGVTFDMNLPKSQGAK